MEDLKRLNKLLADRFGKHFDGRPKWKLAWSEDLFEHRHGYFEDYHGDIFLRSFEGVRYVRKYTSVHNRWILETLTFEPNNQIIKGAENGHYEYIKAFGVDRNGKPIMPTWNMLEFLVKLIIDPVKAKADIKAMEAADKKKFIEEAMDILEDHKPFIAGKLADGSAVVNPGVN